MVPTSCACLQHLQGARVQELEPQVLGTEFAVSGLGGSSEAALIWAAQAQALPLAGIDAPNQSPTDVGELPFPTPTRVPRLPTCSPFCPDGSNSLHSIFQNDVQLKVSAAFSAPASAPLPSGPEKTCVCRLTNLWYLLF